MTWATGSLRIFNKIKLYFNYRALYYTLQLKREGSTQMKYNLTDFLLGRHSAERTEFRDRNGWYTGKAITRNDKTAFYDRNGFYQGTMRQGDDDDSKP